ncbi:MAG: alpha/beta fold hydrolase [Opitutae bacterium]|nr:alpha/beta fold hydrolase [Opitutae bacterium]
MKTRALLLLVSLFQFTTTGVGADAPSPTPLAAPAAKPVMLIVHGAWGGAWQFSKVDPLLRERGFDVRRVTLTGLGERAHLGSKDIGLETHIQDVVNVILFERLENIILVGHSYGGMVITGVADRLPERIKKLVYLDAMLPNDGESAFDVMGGRSEWIERMTKDGMIVPSWVQPGKPHPFDVPHPLKTFTDPLALKNPAREKISAVYLLTVDPGKKPEQDDFWKSAERARARGWPVTIMEADHNPQWRKPAETAELLGTLN